MRKLALLGFFMFAAPAYAGPKVMLPNGKQISVRRVQMAKEDFGSEWNSAGVGYVHHAFTPAQLDAVVHSFLGNSPAEKVAAAMAFEKLLEKKRVPDFLVTDLVEGDGTGNSMGAARRAMSADKHFSIYTRVREVGRDVRLRAYDVLAKLAPDSRGSEAALFDSLMNSDFIGPTRYGSVRGRRSRYQFYRSALEGKTGDARAETMAQIDALEAIFQESPEHT